MISVLLCAAAACSSDSTGPADGGADAGVADAAAPDQCPSGLQAVGAACAPGLSTSCKDDEVPLSDGGCKRVGVAECDGGIKAPPSWTCKPVGPPAKCLTGWTTSTSGWCEPVRPSAACPDGKLAVIGKSSCQPLGDCGSGTWGKITTTSSTIFVDASYAGGGSNGSQAQPYTTIGDALKAAYTSSQIAVAEGTYAEDVIINHAYIKLEGRCAEMVVIKGQSALGDALRLGSTKIRVSGVTVTGPGTGISIAGTGATLERVSVSTCGASGVAVVGSGSATIKDSVIVGNDVSGVEASGSAEVTLERTEVRDNKATTAQAKRGDGIFASGAAKVTVTDSLISGNTSTGLGGVGATLTAERSAITDTKAQLATNLAGPGALIYGSGKLILRDCLVHGNTMVGVLVGSSEATIERTTIAGTLTAPLNGLGGHGMQVNPAGSLPTKAKLTLKESLVAENHEINVMIANSDAVIERSVIRDGKLGKLGIGYGIQSTASQGTWPADVQLRDSVIEGNTANAISVVGSRLTAERSVLRDTKSPGAKQIGAAVATDMSGTLKPTFTLRDCLVTRNAAASLHVYNAKATLERTVVRDTRPDADDFFGFGIYVNGKNAPALTATESVIAGNRSVGVLLLGAAGDFRRTVFRDTAAEQARGILGIGLYATQVVKSPAPSKVKLSDCLLLDNRAAGIGLWDKTGGTVTRTVVSGTKRDSKGKYGDGIVVGTGAKLDLDDSLVSGSARAGALFIGCGGTVERSVFRSGELAVDLESGAKPEIGADNVYEKNKEDRVTSNKGLEGARVPDAL